MRFSNMKFIRPLSIVFLASALMAVACTPTRTQKSAGEQIDDTVLLAKVKAALIADPVAEAHEINVEVFRGIVQLNGFVETSAEKSRAGKVARDVGGVKDVKNNLTVKHEGETVGAVIDDATVTAKVKAALIDSSRTKAYQIEVETQKGVVQLSGFVDDASAKSAAVEIARSVAGVKSVINDIDVK